MLVAPLLIPGAGAEKGEGEGEAAGIRGEATEEGEEDGDDPPNREAAAEDEDEDDEEDEEEDEEGRGFLRWIGPCPGAIVWTSACLGSVRSGFESFGIPFGFSFRCQLCSFVWTMRRKGEG